MDELHDFIAAEKSMRELLDQGDLAQPDEVQYWESSVVFMWHSTKTAVIVDLTDGPDPE